MTTDGTERYTYGCPECGKRVISIENEVWCYECPAPLEQICTYQPEAWDDLHTTGMDQSPFDETVEGIATVLDDLPPMQVLRAVQQLAEDPDARMGAGDVRTTAANISSDEDLRSLIGRGESLDPSSTATGGGDGDA